jgi:hypothetical protein
VLNPGSHLRLTETRGDVCVSTVSTVRGRHLPAHLLARTHAPSGRGRLRRRPLGGLLTRIVALLAKNTSRSSVLWALCCCVVQHDQAARLTWIQAPSTGGVRACLRRVAGCATPTGSAGHAGATANLKLTFHLDHSAGADQGVAVGTQSFQTYQAPKKASGKARAPGLVARLPTPKSCCAWQASRKRSRTRKAALEPSEDQFRTLPRAA